MTYKNLISFLVRIFLLSGICFSNTLYAQLTAEEILKKSIEAVAKIEKGSYKIDFKMKYLDKKDTFKLSGLCYFEKDKKIKYGAKFNIQQSHGYTHIYYGKEIYYLTERDSSALLINTKKFGYSYIEGNVASNLIYEPIINESVKKLINNEKIEAIDFTGETLIHQKPCYELIIKFKDDGDVKNNVINYYIDKETYIPIKKNSNLDWKTQHQYKEDYLYDITLNKLPSPEEKLFGYQGIPTNFSLKTYSEPAKRTKEEMSLTSGISAPDFELKSLDAKQIKLSNLQGKLVLLDFSYQACYGCKLALPELQKLHERYSKDGLVILGINPVDTSLADFKEYIDKQNIDFQFLTASKEIAKQYKVQVYPTFYLIDSKGKIIYSDIGYSEKQFARLEKTIQRQLKK